MLIVKNIPFPFSSKFLTRFAAVFTEQIAYNFSYVSIAHNIVNPTTNKDNLREQAASTRSTLAKTPNALRNKRPDTANVGPSDTVESLKARQRRS